MFAKVDASPCQFDSGQVFESVQHIFKGKSTNHSSRKIAHAAQNDHHDGMCAHVKAHELGVDIAALRSP